MRFNKTFITIVLCLVFLSVSLSAGNNPPKTTEQLLIKYSDIWYEATHHPFLEQAKDGTLPEEAFFTWLGQDYHFASNLIDGQCFVLKHAPRADQALLIGGLFALDSELTWFEENASLYNIDLTQPLLPTCQKYADFLLAMQYKPYVVQITCIWALELAYYDSWSTALPGAPKYKEFIDRWTSEDFWIYVDDLDSAVNAALSKASKEERELAETYFLWVVKYEKDFWDMALSGE